MTRPRLLDLFCGAGGASAGYVRAGFDVVGVDINRQPHYPYEFVQADAMDVLRGLLPSYVEPFAPGFNGGPINAIHASPPCQSYSRATNNLWGAKQAATHPDLLGPVRDLLHAIGLPYVIENVEGSPILASVMLCGTMFGLPLRKHRWFETSFDVLMAPASCGDHRNVYNPWKGAPGVRSIEKYRAAQETPWMPAEGGASRKTAHRTGADINDAIPPAYTEWIGGVLLESITAKAA